MMDVEEVRQLLRSEGFSPLFDGHPDGLFVFTADGRFVAGNPPFRAGRGDDPERLAGLHFRDVVLADDVELAVAEFEAAAAGERRQYVAGTVLADGSVVRRQITHLPFVHDGTTVAVLGIAKDVAEFERIVADNATRQRLLWTAGRLARFAGWRVDLVSSTTSWSDEMYAILGYPPEPSRRPRDRLLDESSPGAAEVADAIARCAAGGEEFTLEADVIDANGATLRLQLLGEPVRDASGAIVAVEGAAVDVTEREAGRRAESLLSKVLDSINDAFFFLDRDWVITYLNPRAQEIVGADAEAVVGRVLWEIYPNGGASEFAILYRQAVSENRPMTVRDYYPPLQMWFEATAYPTGTGVAVYLRDVTEVESVRQQLVARVAELSAQNAMLEEAQEAIIVRDLDGTIRYWNAAATRLYGWTRDEAVGRLARELIYAGPDQFDRVIQVAMREGRWSGELQQIDKSGALRDVRSSWTVVRDEHGEPESLFSITTDITEEKRRDALELRAQRMESLGTLASGIAHDLNNVLAPILMAVQLLSPGETDPARLQILNSTELAVQRGADMIRQVLSFASGTSGQQVDIDLADVVAELESMNVESRADGARLQFDVAEDLWPVTGDPTQLLQVLLNLVTNARDAAADDGTVTVRVRNLTLSDEYTSVSHIAPPGDYVQVEVEDNGGGMSPAVLGKIFEPFFTTKKAGSGTGLGLSTSLAIVRGHGGYMQAYSEPGRGSTFRVHLPVQRQRPELNETAVTERIQPLPRGENELVLVVDDIAAMRMMARQVLEAYGYRTAVASNGAEALEFIESGREVVDVVLTDMAMPVMGGAAMASYLRENHPSIPVIATSGLVANGDVAGGGDSGIRFFLPKPYTTSDLLRTLVEALHPAASER
ncbi:MAG TPA: PAS domain-containing protein [Pseudolysinimonas sp.]|nr:PAS domain-containing protein [Pseudolysinimonas sp.]